MKKKKTLAESLIEYCEKKKLKYNITRIDMEPDKDLNKFLKEKRKAEKQSSKAKIKFKTKCSSRSHIKLGGSNCTICNPKG